ncbi:MAG: hypothetical protein H6Q65_2547 [Firmicutes bacterium]|nr:hypothetical protein [Bacillota bacterium]
MAEILKKPWLLLMIVVLNLLGTVWGFFWYENQLAITPWYFLPFVPDCPLHALFFAFFAYWLLTGNWIRAGWQRLIAWTAVLGGIKYGVWTVVILGQYFLTTGQPPAGDDLLLFVSHAGMLIQGLAYLRFLPSSPMPAVLAVLWFSFNDYFDYIWGTLPALPLSGQFLTAAYLALLMTMTVIGITVIFFKKIRDHCA